MSTQLILAAIGGIATIVVLIVWLKVHPFLSLMAGAGVMAIAAGVPYVDLFTSFTTGLGSTVAGVGLLITLGAIIGTLLISSGGADVIVDTIMSKTPVKRLPWAMALIAFVVGIPLFFEVGVVILIPVVMFAAKRAKLPVVLLGIPALAGLSALHGLVPPHPGPLIAIDALGANLGLTLGFGLLVAIPCVIISGPLLGKVMARWVPIQARDDFLGGDGPAADDKRPSFLTALTIVLGMRVMGSMLISSLVIFPALTAMRVCRSFKSVTVCAALVAVVCFFIGLCASYLLATPAGASVVVANILAFLIFMGIGKLRQN